MPLPFYIYCDLPFARVYELDDGRFQFIEKGESGPFMAGYQSLLVENALASFLRTLELDRVKFEPAVLFDRITGNELNTHTRIRVGQLFQMDQMLDIALDGPRLLTLNNTPKGARNTAILLKKWM
ncbi:MAG: hypothetical protein V4582_16520 [Pseudomonadota bacterium]